MGAAGDGVTLQQFPSRALEAYGETEFGRLDRKLATFRALSQDDRDVLPEFEKRISAMASCVEANTKLLAKMAESATGIKPTARTTTSSSPSSSPSPSTSAAAENVVAATSGRGDGVASITPAVPTLTADGVDEADGLDGAGGLQEDPKVVLSRGVRRGFAILATDWSTAGATERSRIYMPLVTAVDEAFEEAQRAARSLQRENFRVLVPGAGGGRLPWELARKGFCVEGCEESFIALLIGNFVMNSVDVNDTVTVYPYVHEHSNMVSKDLATRGVQVPDVNPKDIPATADFTMRAGRFVDAYDGQDNSWDAVVSYRAFDVGEGCLEHSRRVAQIVKPGGVWIVVGPTPCVDGAHGDGVHISGEEFLELIRRCGFKIIKNDSMKSLYSTDEKSLRTVHVDCPFVVAVKVRPLA